MADLIDRQARKSPFEYIRFRCTYTPLGREEPRWLKVSNIQAQVADLTDRAIVNAIIETAKQEGIDDLYLIDKQFVIDALMEKIEREQLLKDVGGELWERYFG